MIAEEVLLGFTGFSNVLGDAEDSFRPSHLVSLVLHFLEELE
jgi:hypothetical protein